MTRELPRWIWASVCKHFESKRDGLAMRFEGDSRSQVDCLELRMDGPDWFSPSHGVEICDIYLNVLVTAIRDERDAHKLQKMVGVAAAAFLDSISVFKFGDGGQLVDCMLLTEQIVITNFGAVEGTPSVLYSTVEGHYRLTNT